MKLEECVLSTNKGRSKVSLYNLVKKYKIFARELSKFTFLFTYYYKKHKFKKDLVNIQYYDKK